MTRRKHLLEKQNFSKLYANAFSEPCTGYYLSQKIYGYSTKSNYILNIIREHPTYFKEITKESWPHPKYQSKPRPLIDYLFIQLNLENEDKNYINHQKKLIEKFMNSKQFLDMIKKTNIVKSTYDIITLLALNLVSIKIYKKVFMQKVTSVKKHGFTLHNIEPFINELEQRYRTRHSTLPNNLHMMEFVGIGNKLTEVGFKLSDKLIDQIIQLSPQSQYMVETIESVIIINDMLWEIKNKQLKF